MTKIDSLNIPYNSQHSSNNKVLNKLSKMGTITLYSRQYFSHADTTYTFGEKPIIEKSNNTETMLLSYNKKENALFIWPKTDGDSPLPFSYLATGFKINFSNIRTSKFVFGYSLESSGKQSIKDVIKMLKSRIEAGDIKQNLDTVNELIYYLETLV